MVQGYGCDVTLVPSATVTAATSLAENNEPDVVPELWVNSAPVYKELEAAGKAQTATNVISDGGQENWWIPAYLAEAHPELTTIEGVLAPTKTKSLSSVTTGAQQPFLAALTWFPLIWAHTSPTYTPVTRLPNVKHRASLRTPQHQC